MTNASTTPQIPTLHLPDFDFSTFCFITVPAAAFAEIQNVVGRCGLAILTMRWNGLVEWVEGENSLGFIPTTESTSTLNVISGDEEKWLTYPGLSVSEVLVGARSFGPDELPLEAAEAVNRRIVEDPSTGRWEVLLDSDDDRAFFCTITPAATTMIPTAALAAICDCVDTNGSAQLAVTWDGLVQRWVMGDPDGMRPDKYSRAIFHVHSDEAQLGADFQGPQIWTFLTGASAMPLAKIRGNAANAVHDAIRADFAAEGYNDDHWSDEEDTQFYTITPVRSAETSEKPDQTAIPTAAMEALREGVATNGSARLAMHWGGLIEMFDGAGVSYGSIMSNNSRALFGVLTEGSSSPEFEGPTLDGIFPAGEPADLINECIVAELAAAGYDIITEENLYPVDSGLLADGSSKFYTVTPAGLLGTLEKIRAHERSPHANPRR